MLIPMSKKRLRSPWVFTVGATALVGACGSELKSNPPSPQSDGGSGNDSGADGGNPSNCPAAPPTVGASCAVPTTEYCTYGDPCSPTGFECVGGAWNAIHGNPPAPSCPPTPPNGACMCYPPNFQCKYGNATCNGVPNPQIAACSNGQWVYMISTCNPPAPDSGVHDAGDADAHD